MAFINFDCPECGHNLEVDERGAGFIVKCPECQEPIQIPDMPTEADSRRGSETEYVLPFFKEGTMYKGMAPGRWYTIKELLEEK